MTIKNYIGVDIGGTKCAVTLRQNHSAQLLDKRAFATKDYRNPDACTEKLCEEIDALLHAHAGTLAAIGISCGGPLDSERGLIQAPPNLPEWVDYPIVARLEERFHAPAVLENDANACALAEWKFGAGRGYRNLVFLTCGTGFGAGLILNGRLYRGTTGMAGEVGHLRLERSGPAGYGKVGSAEGFCGGSGIAQLGHTLALAAFQQGKSAAYCPAPNQLEQITARSIAEAARQGDACARQVYETFALQLARTLAILVDLLNPEAIILGSIYERNADWLADLVHQELRKEALDASLACCKILPGLLGDAIGDYAALSLVMDAPENR